MCNHFIYNDNILGYPVGNMVSRYIRMAVLAVDEKKGGDPMLIGYHISADADNLKIPDSSDYKRFGIAEPKERK